MRYKVGHYYKLRNLKFQVTYIKFNNTTNKGWISVLYPYGTRTTWQISKGQPLQNLQEISYEEFIEDMEMKPHFTIGKYYQHASGLKMAIRGEVCTATYGNTLIGETSGGDLRPVGKSPDNMQGWFEITKEEFTRVTQLEVGKFYYNSEWHQKIKVLVFVKSNADDNLFAVETPEGVTQIIACNKEGSKDWKEISEEAFLQ